MISLENTKIHASFSSKGGELQSLRSKETNLEYLWSGNPDYWGKFSPILFPIVGGLKDNTYYYKDKAFTLPRHGLAREREFKVSQISETEILFTLEQDEESLKVYPFEFRLGLRYTLSGDMLSCAYEVTNTGDQALWFSIGGHPAFAVPLREGLKYGDYYLQFNKDHQLISNKIKQDLIDDETETIALTDGKLQLKHELFYEDALVFKRLQSDSIFLKSDADPHGLEFQFKGFPFFGIWSAKDADFVCLEPWCGIADGSHHQQKLEEKEGIMSLNPKEEWTRQWQVTCF
ncbi:Galactose mutarotase [Pedobacter steynii]|uniref:Galactose mutarotase n=1 Tax=Pedobacter steynii TaxID=430522 RepID=A0A1G9PU92_9SPHI|nr:aldose 1-epimerase family protein [Pedobacter steynii]NQX38878.1 aldose 1-epimerase family protein [Pedobacter steynii]SDM02233.1 Galactose mutarotase [Pedobacter steynii]